jgi:hypothetical protein
MIPHYPEGNPMLILNGRQADTHETAVIAAAHEAHRTQEATILAGVLAGQEQDA